MVFFPFPGFEYLNILGGIAFHKKNMAKILDKDKESVLIKITVSEYKALEKMDFFSG